MEIKYYNFDVSALRSGDAGRVTSDDVLRKEILRPYKDILPSDVGLIGGRKPGVFVEGRSDSGGKYPLSCYVIHKGAPLSMLDYSSYYLQALSRMRSFNRSSQIEAASVGGTSNQGAQEPEHVCVGIGASKKTWKTVEPSRFALSVGHALSWLKVKLAWIFIAPVAFLFRWLHMFLPNWVIKTCFTAVGAVGIVASRVFIALVLMLIAYGLTTDSVDYSRYLIERMIESLSLT